MWYVKPYKIAEQGLHTYYMLSGLKWNVFYGRNAITCTQHRVQRLGRFFLSL